MAMPGCAKNYTAAAAIAKYTLVKLSADETVTPATAATDAVMGIAELGCTAANDRVDIVKGGIAKIKLGGTVARGGPITAGAAGVGVAAAPSAGVNNRIIGFAETSGVSGDIIDVWVSPSVIQG